MLSRRDFIKMLGLMGGFVLAPVRRLGQWAGVDVTAGLDEPAVGELYAGFVLLPEGAKVPGFVEYPKRGIPKLCGVGDSNGPLATTQLFKTDLELANSVAFPIYTIKDPPIALMQKDIYITRYPTGDIYCTTICFSDPQTSNDEVEGWKVYLWAYPDFSRPYPLWYSEPVEADSPSVTFDKVVFLPQPGIISRTSDSFSVYWIERDVLYYVLLEPVPDIQYAQTVIEHLAQIG